MTNEEYIKRYGISKEEYFKINFNEVGTLTAKCKSNECQWPIQEDYPELEIGKTYDVSHIGVFRSYPQIILSDFDDKQYSSACFDLFENGEPLDRRFADDQRFWAPYLREKFGM